MSSGISSNRVYVSLGSNLDREAKIRGAVMALRHHFGEIDLSPVYDSVAFGFEGNDFLNMVVGFDSQQVVTVVVAIFRQIEDQLGRDRSQPRFSSRLIDLDILTFGDEFINQPGIRVPRPEILEQAFVLRPLQDIAANEMHPVLQQTYRQLWEKMAPDIPDLKRFDLNFG